MEADDWEEEALKYTEKDMQSYVQNALEVQLLLDRLRIRHLQHIVDQNFNMFCPRCRYLLRRQLVDLAPERSRNFKAASQGHGRQPSTPGEPIIRFI